MGPAERTNSRAIAEQSNVCWVIADARPNLPLRRSPSRISRSAQNALPLAYVPDSGHPGLHGENQSRLGRGATIVGVYGNHQCRPRRQILWHRQHSKDTRDLLVAISQVPTLLSWLILLVGLLALAYLYSEWLSGAVARTKQRAGEWELRSPIARKSDRAAAPSGTRELPLRIGPTQTVHVKGLGPSTSSLTREQEHFRLELRKFITRLATAYRKLGDAFVAVEDVGRSRQPINFLARFGLDSLRPKIEELEQLAHVPIEAMQQDRLQVICVEFLRWTYGGAQTLISRLGEALRQAGVEIDENNPRLSRKIGEWLEADAECLEALKDLNTSPEAKTLKTTPLKFFGTVDRNRWGAGLR